MRLKRFLLALPLLFSTVSCSGNGSIIGKYTFQLGASDETHVGIYLELTDEETTATTEPTARKFSMTFNARGAFIEQLIPAQDAQEPTDPNKDTIITIDGYYYLGDVIKGVQHLNIGITLLDTIDIDPLLVEKLMYATVGDGQITFNLPVSITDLQYQLYWYGYRVSNVLDLLNPIDLKQESSSFETWLEGNYPGSHPSKEVIENFKTYQKDRKDSGAEGYEEGEDIFLTYHDFHTISMGFAK